MYITESNICYSLNLALLILQLIGSRVVLYVLITYTAIL